MTNAVIKKIPSKERCWTTYVEDGRPVYKVTSTQDRSMYYLYKITPCGYEKVSKSERPNEFDAVVYPQLREVKSKSKAKKKTE